MSKTPAVKPLSRPNKSKTFLILPEIKFQILHLIMQRLNPGKLQQRKSDQLNSGCLETLFSLNGPSVGKPEP